MRRTVIVGVVIAACSDPPAATGVAAWRLRVDDDDTLVINGVDHGGAEVASFVMRSTDTEVRLDTA